MKNKIFILLLLAFVMISMKGNDLLPTALKITVLNELGNIESGVTVTLYHSDDDYRAEKNPVMPGKTTNKKGKVVFKKLKSKVYFVHAEKGDKNNNGAGVQTDKLKEGLINKVTIIIE